MRYKDEEERGIDKNMEELTLTELMSVRACEYQFSATRGSNPLSLAYSSKNLLLFPSSNQRANIKKKEREINQKRNEKK